jgi:hypothetical protein
VVCVVADSAFDRVVSRGVSTDVVWRSAYLRCTETYASLAALYRTGQFFYPTSLKADILPSLVERLLHLVGHVDDLRSGDDIIPPVDESIEDLVEPETIFCLAIFIEIANLTPVQNLAFAS